MNPNHLKLKIFIVALSILLVVGAGFLFNNSLDLQRPPSLAMGNEALKGLIGGNRNFFSFTQSDLERIGDFAAATPRPMGIQYYYAEENINFQSIIQSIKPELDNQCIIITYMAEDKKFHTYPRGPFQGTAMVSEAQLTTFEVPSAQAFLIVCTKETATINIKHSTDQPRAFDNSFDWRSEGWHLTAFSSSEDLARSVSSCSNRTKSIWVQKGENGFEKTELDAPALAPGYYLAWLMIEGPANSCVAGNGSQNTPQVDSAGSGQESDGLTIYQHLNQNYAIDENRLQER